MSSHSDDENFESMDTVHPSIIKPRTHHSLIQAVTTNNVKRLKELIDSSKWYRLKDQKGNSLLHTAVINASVEVFDFLLSLNNCPLEEVNDRGETPLIMALVNNVGYHSLADRGEHFSLELLKKRIAVSATSTCSMDEGDTLLHWALAKGYVKVAELLIEKGIGLSRLHSGENPSLLMNKANHLMDAVETNNIQRLKELLDSPMWYRLHDGQYNSLLHLAIINQNVETFDFLLSLDNFPLEQVNDEGYTPLVMALVSDCEFHSLNDKGEHFSLELLKKGVAVPKIYATTHSWFVSVGDTLLHCAVARHYNKVVQLLLERGADVNSVNKEGQTPLFKCFNDWFNYSNELIAMLLCYGADTLISDRRGYNIFDRAIGFYVTDLEIVHMEENLFFYTFDGYTTQFEIAYTTLLTMAECNSWLFKKIVRHITYVKPCTVSSYWQWRFFNCLGWMPLENLQILVKHFEDTVREVLQNASNVQIDRQFGSLKLENVNFLLESSVKEEMLQVIEMLPSTLYISNFIDNETEETVTQIVCLLASYGMKMNTKDLTIVYEKFGYCELFKILLHMDLKRIYVETEIVSLIYNVTTDIESYVRKPRFCSTDCLRKLLQLSAHPELRNYCYQKENPSLVAQAKNLPNVPCLLELARNVFRKYFIHRLNITSARQFYTMLKFLPVSIEKILTYETTLY